MKNLASKSGIILMIFTLLVFSGCHTTVNVPAIQTPDIGIEPGSRIKPAGITDVNGQLTEMAVYMTGIFYKALDSVNRFELTDKKFLSDFSAQNPEKRTFLDHFKGKIASTDKTGDEPILMYVNILYNGYSIYSETVSNETRDSYRFYYKRTEQFSGRDNNGKDNYSAPFTVTQPEYIFAVEVVFVSAKDSSIIFKKDYTYSDNKIIVKSFNDLKPIIDNIQDDFANDLRFKYEYEEVEFEQDNALPETKSARNCFRKGDSKTGLNILEQCTNKPLPISVKSKADYNYGICLLYSGDFVNAEKHLKLAFNADPDNSKYASAIVQLDSQKRKFSKYCRLSN